MEIPEPKKRYPKQRLFLRRQFILGPRYVDSLEGWQHISIGEKGGFRLTVHPDLPVTQNTYNQWQVTLLGFMLDPYVPDFDDRKIVSSMVRSLSESNRMDLLPELTYPYGGRWILIATNGGETWLLNDPMGLRQVVYTNDHLAREIWCASQAGAIADLLGLEMDPGVVTQCIDSPVYKEWEEYLFPADRTPYKEITHLLPNHVLDLKRRVARRFWPDRPLPKLSLDQAVVKVSDQLRGLMRAADKRFDLTLSLSSGWDSRLALAASRDISKRLQCFSLLRYPGSPDEITPPRLARKLGIKHFVVAYPETMEEEFKEIYLSNVTCAHDLQGRMAQGVYWCLPPGRVRVSGNAAEITRVRFRIPAGQPVTPLTMAHFHSFGYPEEFKANKFVVSSWDKWMNDLNDLHNVHILDLFYWEHWAGNFVAMVQLEWDIAQEGLTPYNCRQILVDMLSVDEKYRDHDRPELFRRLCAAMWSKVLSVPVNSFLPSYVDRAVNLGLHRFAPKGIRKEVKRYFKVSG